jgi:hypothetical protein
MIGSRKYPTERERGHSWTTEPPEMTPGLRRSAVPVKGLFQTRIALPNAGAPVTEISITVPLVTRSNSLRRLIS